MSGGMAMFQSELRSAVREARSADPAAAAAPAPVRPEIEAPTRAVKRTVIRLWLPLTPLWWLLSPFALLLAPLLWLVPMLRGVNPWRAAFALGAALLNLSGTVIDVEAPDATIRIRIF
jgi:hypothetical protein